jgi:hypothetical protein
MSSDLVQIRPHRSHQDASSPPLLASFWLVPSLRARRRGEDWGGDRENSRRSFWRSASHLTPAGLRLIPAPAGIPFRWVIESAVAAVFEVAIDCTDGRGARREPRFCPTGGHVSRPCRLRGEPHRGGHLFERDRTTVAHACGLVEDRRDDPDFDHRLNHLERAVSCLLDAL